MIHSCTLFSFCITDEIKEHENEIEASKIGTLKSIGFDIWTYDFMNVKVETIIKEVIKIVEKIENNDGTTKEFRKNKNDILKFLNACIKGLK